MKVNLFPSGIASGKAFCNREKERRMLSHNIQQTRHTLIVSPRRYGKTSLALYAISEAGEHHCAYINFFNALRDEDVMAKFVNGFSELLSKLMPVTSKAVQALSQSLRRISVMIEVKGIKASFNLKVLSQEPIGAIKALLEDIEKLLKANNKKIVIFLDEFQDIIKTEKSDLLQSELRDFAQRTKYMTFIISGSHRHMLNKIFDDRNKPFYKLCDRINLARIKASDYEPFLQKHAHERWEKNLSIATLNSIFKLTEAHPYYINKICAKLWFLDQMPNEGDVDKAWKNLSEEEYDSVVNDISLLSINQRLVLQYFSKKEYVMEPNSSQLVQELKMAQSSIRQALNFLLNNDFIEKIDRGYRVIDPLIKFVLNEVSPEKR